MPVVCCSLHSQVVPVCAALAGLRVAYVQLAGRGAPAGALRRRARAQDGACRVDRVRRRLLRRRRRVRDAVVGARLGEGGRARRRRLRDRARDRRHGSRLGHGGLAAATAANAAIGARRPGRGRGARVRGRRARAPPGRLAPHAGRARPLPGRGARRRRGGRRGLARGVRRAAALAHGPRPRRGPGVLRGGLRRRRRARRARSDEARRSRAPPGEGKLLAVTLERWGDNEREIVEHPARSRSSPSTARTASSSSASCARRRGSTLLELPAGTLEPARSRSRPPGASSRRRPA